MTTRRKAERRAKQEARLEAVRQLRRARCCEWCGGIGTADNPLSYIITSPPVDGYPVEGMLAHDHCASEAARAAVQ